MHAHEAEVAELRGHLAAARATGAMLTASAEEAEELQRRVDALEAEASGAAARREVRLCTRAVCPEFHVVFILFLVVVLVDEHGCACT